MTHRWRVTFEIDVEADGTEPPIESAVRMGTVHECVARLMGDDGTMMTPPFYRTALAQAVWSKQAIHADCGHDCCDERHDPHHDHFLTAADCPACASVSYPAKDTNQK